MFRNLLRVMLSVDELILTCFPSSPEANNFQEIKTNGSKNNGKYNNIIDREYESVVVAYK